MLNLYIDGQKVLIDADTALEVIQENPVLGKSGEYSFDIDIDLRVPENRKIYGAINRFAATAIPSGRRAVVTDGALVVCMGTEVILSLTDKSAKIQIVSGNSEFNYLLGTEEKIRHMNFGTFTTPSASHAASVRLASYPTANAVYPPMTDFSPDALVAGEGEQEVFNRYDLPNGSYADGTSWMPQPFLLYYVEKIVELLGYTLESNCLRDDERWKHLIVAHRNPCTAMAECLPDWTASEFINEVEKFFNVIYLVNSISRKVRIVSMRDFYEDQEAQVIDDTMVLDEYERVLNASGGENIPDYRNCAYRLPSKPYYKYADIDDQVLRLVSIHDNVIADNLYEGMSPAKDFVIERDTELGVYYRNRSPIVVGEAQEVGERPMQCMQFQHVADDGSPSSMELKIVPAEVRVSGTLVATGGYGEPTVGNALILVSPDFESEEQVGCEEAITSSGVSKDGWDVMQVAFYHGSLHTRVQTPGQTGYHHDDAGMPMCITQRYALEHRYVVHFSSSETGCENETLELDGEDGRVAVDFTNRQIDTTQQYIVQFRVTHKLDAGRLFIIRNRLFYCQQLKYRFGGGKGILAEGLFYPAQ